MYRLTLPETAAKNTGIKTQGMHATALEGSCVLAAQQPGSLAHGLRWVEGRRPERASCLGGDGFRMMLRHAMKNAKRGCEGWRLRGGKECWDVGVQLNMKAHSRGKSGEADD